jgi:Rieske Fe-S protein
MQPVQGQPPLAKGKARGADMTAANHKLPVSPFHPVGSETLKQTEDWRNTPRNKIETTSLKALALQVLQRNRHRNTPETQPISLVSPPASAEIAWGLEDYLAWFDERAAIYEFDAGYSRLEAERLAYSDTCQHFGQSFPEETRAMLEYILTGQPIN